MREFFVLTYDDRDDLQSVSDYEMGEFDLTLFWNGEPFNGPIPADVKLFIGEGEPSDYLANPVSWPIVSNRLLTILNKLLKNDFQSYPAPVYDERSRSVQGLHIINITKCVNCLATPLV